LLLNDETPTKLRRAHSGLMSTRAGRAIRKVRGVATGRPRIHQRGESRLDGMLALVDIAGRSQPLADTLGQLASQVASLLGVDVCSIYLLDLANVAPALSSHAKSARDELVLVATHGFHDSARFAVRMRVGEGLTGFAVECLRPVSVARAPADARNKTFADLDDDRFPSLCAVPLVEGGRAVGAMVVQRRGDRAFSPSEIVLAASVTAPILLALERARSRQAASVRNRGDMQRAHAMALYGIAISPGARLGRVCVPTRAATATAAGDRQRARLLEALDYVQNRTDSLIANLHARFDGARLRPLVTPLQHVMHDARLRGEMCKHVDAGETASAAITRVMADCVRSMSSAGDAMLLQRAAEIEALCLRLQEYLAKAPPASLSGGVLVASRFTIYDLLELASQGGVGVALGAREVASHIVELARLVGLPIVCGVPALLQWAKAGDQMIIDGAAGTLTLNPSRLDVAEFRRRN
jgi:phosphotransferase system enzyme I (PtsP)